MTATRRSVRNALFREMMTRPCKVQEPPMRTQFGPIGPDEIVAFSPLVSPDYLTACRALVNPTPPPPPLLRWWRRILWGE
jgi:hypothetical protein